MQWQGVASAAPYFPKDYIFITFCLDMCWTINLSRLYSTRCWLSEFHILLILPNLLIKKNLKTIKFMISILWLQAHNYLLLKTDLKTISLWPFLITASLVNDVFYKIIQNSLQYLCHIVIFRLATALDETVKSELETEMSRWLQFLRSGICSSHHWVIHSQERLSQKRNSKQHSRNLATQLLAKGHNSFHKVTGLPYLTPRYRW